MLRVLLTAAILSTLASSVLAQGGFRIDVQPIDTGGSSTLAQSNWLFRIQQKGVVLHWTCSSFTHSQNQKLRTDASIRAVVTEVQGPVQIQPVASEARTDVYHGKQATSFDMQMQGTGKLNVLLEISIDSENAAAGSHTATVELTVTGL